MKTVQATIGYFVTITVEVADDADDSHIRQALCNEADECMEARRTNGDLEPIVHECESYPELVD